MPASVIIDRGSRAKLQFLKENPKDGKVLK